MATTEPNKTNEIATREPSDLVRSFLTSYKIQATTDIKRALDFTDQPIKSITNPLAKLQTIQKAIEKNVEIHFGIRSGLLSDDLVKAVISDISQKYGFLSVKDLDFAFEKYAEERTDWKNVTKKNILNPVIQWLNLKHKIRLEFDKHSKEIQKREEGERKRQEFEEQALHFYRLALERGEWEGTVFHASAIAKKYFADKISKEEKDALWIQAQRDYKEAKAKAEVQAEERSKGNGEISFTPELMGVSSERIFSQLVIKKAIQQKIKIK